MLTTTIVCDGCGDQIEPGDERVDFAVIRVGAAVGDGSLEPAPPPVHLQYHPGHVPERVADLKERE